MFAYSFLFEQMVWQKRHFVLDGNNHELRYAENSKPSSKIKGSVSLRIPDMEVHRRQRQPSMSTDDFVAFFSVHFVFSYNSLKAICLTLSFAGLFFQN